MRGKPRKGKRPAEVAVDVEALLVYAPKPLVELSLCSSVVVRSSDPGLKDEWTSVCIKDRLSCCISRLSLQAGLCKYFGTNLDFATHKNQDEDRISLRDAALVGCMFLLLCSD